MRKRRARNATTAPLESDFPLRISASSASLRLKRSLHRRDAGDAEICRGKSLDLLVFDLPLIYSQFTTPLMKFIAV